MGYDIVLAAGGHEHETDARGLARIPLVIVIKLLLLKTQQHIKIKLGLKKTSLPQSFFHPLNSQSTKNMHKTHIFDQKNNAKKFFLTDLPTLFFFWTVTGNKQFLFLGLILLRKYQHRHCKHFRRFEFDMIL